MTNKENGTYWELLIAMSIMLLAIIGVNVPLFIMTDNKIEAIRQDIREFHVEMKRLDVEFKDHMLYEHGKKEKNK